MNNIELKIDFPDAPLDQSSRLVHELAELIQIKAAKEGSQIGIELERADEESMNFGATLILVLGAPAIVIIAEAVRDFLGRKGRATFRANGIEIIADSDDLADAIRAAARLSHHA